MNLLILGAGGHGRVVRELAASTKKYERISFLDDCFKQPSCPDDVIGNLNDLPGQKDCFEQVFIAIGNPEIRNQYQTQALALGFDIPVLLHDSACVSSQAVIGKGTVVMPQAVVQTNVRLGQGCIISSGAIVDHDADIKEYCHINAGAVVPSYSVIPAMTKLDYGQVYKIPKKANTGWMLEHKKQFGEEPGFF